MSHASMLKARRKHQKTKKLLDNEAKAAKRLAKLASAGPVVKKEEGKEGEGKEGESEEGRGQDGKSENGQADQGGAWQAGITKARRECRKERHILDRPTMLAIHGALASHGL